MTGVFHRLFSNVRQIARVAVIGFLLIPVTGSSGLVLQGVAWIKMAQQAGGLSELYTVIFDADPCDLCRTAHQASSDTKRDTTVTFSLERVEVVRLGSDPDATVPAPRVVDVLRVYPQVCSDFLPSSRGERPATPPPRLA